MNTRFHTLFLLTFLVMPFALFGETIFNANLASENLTTGVTVAGSDCSLQDQVPSWATGYSKAFQTSSSTGKATINFASELSLSDFTDVQLTVHWGATNGRPLKVAFNGGSATQIHGNLASSDRKKVVETSCSITVASISSIALSSSGGDNVFFFEVTITGTRKTPLASNTRTVCLNPNISNWKLGNERYAVYCFGDGEEWYNMTRVTDGCGMTYYKADVDLKYTAYIFCRMNGGTTENNWDNKWNQTNDLPKGTGTYCTITSGGGGNTKAGCNWNHNPFEICVSGPDVAFADEPLILTAKCPGATFFQWYKDGTDESNKIEGATSATYRKSKSVFEDAGTYYCKAGPSESAVLTSSGRDVKLYRIFFTNGRWGNPYGNVDIKFNTDPDHRIAAGMIFLGESWDYAFSINDGFEENWYGNNNDEDHKMNSGNCTNWEFTRNQPKCWLRTENGATYTIYLDYSNPDKLKISFRYPSDNQEAGKMIYFANDIVQWDKTKVHYRVGKAVNPEHPEVFPHTQKESMTLVHGTDNFFQYETKAYNDLHAWHVANNCGWAGTGANGTDDTRSIYRTKTGDEYDITHSVTYEGGATFQDITIIPEVNSHTGKDEINNNCQFHSYTMHLGMLTHNVEIVEPEHGTLTVNYVDINNNPQAFSSGNRDLAHTCILTMTAVPECGYAEPTQIFINGSPHGNRAPYIQTEDIVVTATFEVDTYNITYELNGGTINSGNVSSYTFGEGATLPTDVQRSGFDFEGWYGNAACSGDPITEIAPTECENKTYWAKWKAEKPAPVFTWTYDDIVKAGGIYDVKVASTGDAPVTLTIVETISGVDGTFTVGNPATGTVTIGSYPAATTYTYRASSPETANYKAKTEEKTVTIERCETYDIVSYAVDPIDTKTSKPRYYCEASGAGRIMKGTGNNSISTSSGTFTGESWATKYLSASEHSIQVYQEDVFKIVFYVKSTSNTTTINDLRYSDEYKESSGDWTDIKSSAQIIYNDNPSATSLTKNAYETVTIVPPTPMSKDGWLYFNFSSSTQVWGAKLYHPGGDEPTSIEFSGEASMVKYPGDAPFTVTATQTTTPIKSGGTITYKSSDETVATVDANTGEVTILDLLGHTTITATLSGFGCFAPSHDSYSLYVRECTDPCTIAVTAGSAIKCATADVTLTATAADGAAIQWFKDGAALSGKTGTSLTTKEAGIYHVEARKECLKVSNTIRVVNSSPTVEALHVYYYIKADRVTPAVKLFKIANATSWSVTPAAPVGCEYELREDSIIYLIGTPSESLTATNYDITATVSNGCEDAHASLNLRCLEATAKAQIAWVVDGAKNQTLPGTVDANKSTNHPLYQYLEDSGTPDDPSDDRYALLPVNAYCTTDEKKISDYYSQFDLVLLTDYPATDKSPDHDKNDRPHSYSNAIGCLIDEKPILSLEAFVAGCPNWKINTTPGPDNPTEKDITLLCHAHVIFKDTHVDTDEKVKFVKDGSSSGLQGFTRLETPPGMLFIATINGGESGTRVACCERQKVIEARMMMMGVNHAAMGDLTEDGKLIIKQIVDYLLDFKSMADCALIFDNGADNDNFSPDNYHGTGEPGDGKWSTAANWKPTYDMVPKPEQAARIDKHCNVDIENAHCSSIRLRKDDENDWNGTLTILPGGGLTVIDGIKEVHGTNFMTTYPSAAADLVIQANNVGRNGSLVFGNSEDDLAATVEYYSLAKDANVSGKKPVWQYIGIPVKDRPMAIDAYHAAWMCGWESEGEFVSSNWVWVENEDRIQPFKGYCITQKAQKKYTHRGNLCLPETKELPLYYFDSDMDGPGFNMFANSWVAPIDITKMSSEDFGSGVEPTIFIYNTGTRAQYDDIYPDPLTDPITTDGDGTAPGQFNAIPVNAASYMDGSLQKIPTMQGFFVRTANESSLTLDYKRICFDSEKYKTTAETMRAPQRKADEEPATEKIVPEVMRLDVRSANWGDRVYILSHHEFSDAFDRGWDGTKQEGDADAPMLAFVQESGLLAVAAVESADDRYLSFRAGHDSIYTFTFDYNGEKIYLYDQLTRQATQIRTGNTYTFVAHNETAANRFLITTTPPMMPTDIEVVETDDGLHVENYGEQPVQISIVDMQGRILYNMHTTQAVLDIRPLLPAGVYVAYIVAGDKKQVIKLIGGESK